MAFGLASLQAGIACAMTFACGQRDKAGVACFDQSRIATAVAAGAGLRIQQAELQRGVEVVSDQSGQHGMYRVRVRAGA
ncbi:hypothetical protein GCM10010080_06750 [Thermomonas carbonis]|nr:hypothetical protein GCM10010080_06750 [Thermomonas carbonis]